MTGQSTSLQAQNESLRNQVFELLKQVAKLNEQSKTQAPSAQQQAESESCAARMECLVAQEQKKADAAARRADILDCALSDVREILLDVFEELYGPDEASDTYDTSFLLEHFALITEDIQHPASSEAAPESTYGRLLVDGVTILYRK